MPPGARRGTHRVEQLALQIGEARHVGGLERATSRRDDGAARRGPSTARRGRSDRSVGRAAPSGSSRSHAWRGSSVRPRRCAVSAQQAELGRVEIGGVDRRRVVGELGEVRRLAADAGARVEDALARARRRDVGDELRAGVLHRPQAGEERRAARRIAEAVERERRRRRPSTSIGVAVTPALGSCVDQRLARRLAAVARARRAAPTAANAARELAATRRRRRRAASSSRIQRGSEYSTSIRSRRSAGSAGSRAVSSLRSTALAKPAELRAAGLARRGDRIVDGGVGRHAIEEQQLIRGDAQRGDARAAASS